MISTHLRKVLLHSIKEWMLFSMLFGSLEATLLELDQGTCTICLDFTWWVLKERRNVTSAFKQKKMKCSWSLFSLCLQMWWSLKVKFHFGRSFSVECLFEYQFSCPWYTIDTTLGINNLKSWINICFWSFIPVPFSCPSDQWLKRWSTVKIWRDSGMISC